jgi:hypothetical protein
LGGTARKAKILRTGAAGSAVHGFYKSYVNKTENKRERDTDNKQKMIGSTLKKSRTNKE